MRLYIYSIRAEIVHNAKNCNSDADDTDLAKEFIFLLEKNIIKAGSERRIYHKGHLSKSKYGLIDSSAVSICFLVLESGPLVDWLCGFWLGFLLVGSCWHLTSTRQPGGNSDA